MTAASIEDGRLLRSISKSGKVNGDTLSDWAVWSVVEQSSKQIRIEHFGAHDLRRTCAKLCWKNGGDIEQIKFQLGDSSKQLSGIWSTVRARNMKWKESSRERILKHL